MVAAIKDGTVIDHIPSCIIRSRVLFRPHRRVVPRKTRNPFHYGDLVADESFTDRAEELAELKSDIRNGQNVAVIARRRFGNVTRYTEEAREMSGLGFFDMARQDVRFAPSAYHFIKYD